MTENFAQLLAAAAAVLVALVGLVVALERCPRGGRLLIDLVSAAVPALVHMRRARQKVEPPADGG